MHQIWSYVLFVRPDWVLAVGFLLAAGATIHLLLTKRDVVAAVGWIGLVWLVPIVGAVSYMVFGVNRVKRRARRLRPQYGGSDDSSRLEHRGNLDGLESLARGVRRITARPLRGGTAIDTFQNGDEAYPSMLQAIASAKVSVGLSSYIFRNDQWGGQFIQALADAHRRGVDVRVLIDGIGGGWLLSPAYHRLRREDVPAARFMHSMLPWRMPFLNLRSHKKILVVDDTVGFTGGMNIADENVMATRPKEPVQDLHFRIEGPVVAQLSQAFADDWTFVTDQDETDVKDPPDPPSGEGKLARVIDSGPDEDLEKVEYVILQAVACARTSIAIMTPYFLPDERLITALSLAAMRGVSVDLTIPQKSDHVFVDWATHPTIEPLLSDGVRIWRSPLPFHHSKMMVVDGEWCLIGSCNWDIRSFRLNFELCMEIYDHGLAETLSKLMEGCRASELTQAELDRRSLPIRLRDAAARLLLPYL